MTFTVIVLLLLKSFESCHIAYSCNNGGVWSVLLNNIPIKRNINQSKQ